MKSFSILRTNTSLTTNVKIIVDSQYNLFLESIDSQPELSASKYKKVQFNKNNYLDELVPFLFKDMPEDIAYSIIDEDNSNMSTEFTNQYDNLYTTGARNIVNNKNYKEEYEYFAPLYVFKQNIPKYFIIFRIDGPGLINLDKDNFKSEFLKNFKTIKVFDLTRNTVLGEWLDTNFISNINFPVAPLDVDFKNLEFTRWIGIDYKTGGYTYKPFYLEENLENENTLFDFEKLFVSGYKINSIIFPHILNMSFLFDDEPATPDNLRKWSINRFSGFYIDDMEVIDKITPFTVPALKTNTSILEGNVLYNIDGDPFLNGFKSDNDMWVEYLGDFYKVEKFNQTLEKTITEVSSGVNKNKVTIDEVTNPVVTKYRIISDIDMEGEELLLNKKQFYINSSNQIVSDLNGTYSIADFTDSDVNLIEIDGQFHNLIEENGYIKVVTDYGFKFQDNYRFTYYTNSGISGYTNFIDLFITKNNSPSNFKIYKVKFTDIKDFDTNIIDTEYSKFEYEKTLELCETEEPKMYLTDLRANSNPGKIDDFIFKGKVNYIPTSSDYTANLETFRVENSKLTDLWRKNPIHCRWGYQNSVSSNDYPYLLNNNDVHGDFNRTVNTKSLIPKRESRNLDYFYTINSGTNSYLHHSLHLEKNHNNFQDSSFHFELDKYLNIGYDNDYFESIFGTKQSFYNNNLFFNKKKYSYFESGDNTIPNTTLLRGLKFRLYNVDNIKSNTLSIENINLFSDNSLEDYKFSVLLSSNDYMVEDDNTLYSPYLWGTYSNNQDNSSKLGILGATVSIDIIKGDIIELDQFYPYSYSNYQATASIVTGTGSLINGGEGFILDKIYQTSSRVEPGIWRNKLQWKVIKTFQTDKQYYKGNMVLWEDIVYEVIGDVIVTNPTKNPTNDANFLNFTPDSTSHFDLNRNIFWNNSITYTAALFYPTTPYTAEVVYRHGDYYKLVSTQSSIDFWNPISTYDSGDIVINDGKYFVASTFSSAQVPVGVRPQRVNKRQFNNSFIYWTETTTLVTPMWEIIELWDKNKIYNFVDFVIKDDILYYWQYDYPLISALTLTTNSTVNDVPGDSTSWVRAYSLIPDTEFKYTTYDNSIINISGSYFYNIHNPGFVFNPASKSTTDGRLTLDSGITIYINKKWKNVLVNIAINDNTIQTDNLVMDKTRNIERDKLYVETNGRISTSNFIRQLNDLDTLYGFADFTTYVVIEEDGTYKKYNFKNKIEELPYMLICEEPDSFNIKDNSLNYKISTIDKNVLKPNRTLKDGNVDNLSKINFYNDLPLGTEISNSKEQPKVMKNLNNQKNITSFELFRHSGYYMPVFYDIDLFERNDIEGNYVFDTSLSLFGIQRQKVISKINRNGNILKLKNDNTYNSIFPMVDEFGYMVADYFIFKSNWDIEYHLEANLPKISSVPTIQEIYETLYIPSILKKIK